MERRIAAPRGRVWEALTDLAGMERVLGSRQRHEGRGPHGPAFAVGTRWRETRRMFGKEATEEMWVTACEPPERFVVEAESHGTRNVSEWLLRSEGQAETTVRMTFTGVTSSGDTGLLAKVLGGLGARAVGKTVAEDLEDVDTAVEARGN